VDISPFPVLGVLYDGCQRLCRLEFQLGISPSRNFHNHIEYSVLLIHVEWDIVQGVDPTITLFFKIVPDIIRVFWILWQSMFHNCLKYTAATYQQFASLITGNLFVGLVLHAFRDGFARSQDENARWLDQ